MRIPIIFLIAVASSWQPVAAAAAGSDPREKVFRFRKGEARFLYYPERHLLISSGCLDARSGKLECKAYRAFGRSSLRGISMPRGGADPGAVICVKRFGAKVAVGVNAQGAEASFCRFADGSLVSTGSLDFASRQR